MTENILMIEEPGPSANIPPPPPVAPPPPGQQIVEQDYPHPPAPIAEEQDIFSLILFLKKSV